MKQIQAVFFRTAAGSEPVREWLGADDRKAIGDDIRRIEFRWPVGMPLSRPLGRGLHEVRSRLPSDRTARVIFYVSQQQRMILLHGFFKTTQQTPMQDLDMARLRKQEHERSA
jgi:phage-related protein